MIWMENTDFSVAGTEIAFLLLIFFELVVSKMATAVNSGPMSTIFSPAAGMSEGSADKKRPSTFPTLLSDALATKLISMLNLEGIWLKCFVLRSLPAGYSAAGNEGADCSSGNVISHCCESHQ